MNNPAGKICSYCHEEKSTDEFGKNKLKKDGLHYYCKACVRNIRGSNEEETREYFKRYRERNKEKSILYQREYRKQNAFNPCTETIDEPGRREKKRAREKERRKGEDYKKQRSLYMKKKYQADEQYRIKKLFESKLNRLLKDGDKKQKLKDIIGCSIEDFKQYIESKWLPAMSWENYGTEWQMDRTKPFISFDLTNKEERERCFHYTNVQPLFIKTTIIDGIEYIGNMNKNKF